MTRFDYLARFFLGNRSLDWRQIRYPLQLNGSVCSLPVSPSPLRVLLSPREKIEVRVNALNKWTPRQHFQTREQEILRIDPEIKGRV